MAKTRNDLTHGVQGPHHVIDLTKEPSVHRLLTVREVAQRLSVSPTTVYRLRATGQIAYIKVGGALRFRASDVEDYENRRLVTPAGYAVRNDEMPVRLNLAFPVKKRRASSI